MLRAFEDNPFVAVWVEGARRFAETAADVQRRSSALLADAVAAQSLPAGDLETEPAVVAAPTSTRRPDTEPERRGENRAFAKKLGTGASGTRNGAHGKTEHKAG
jgi:hypothetical protein